MKEQVEKYDTSSPEYQRGYRAGSVVGTLHKALEILHWDTNWGEPDGDWQWGFVDAYEKRSGQHIVERG